MKRVLKWIGIVLGGLVGLILVAVGVVYVMSGLRINKSYDVQPAAVAIPTDEASLVEGYRLYKIRGCIDCHGENGAGGILIDDPALGRITVSNLTSGQGGIGQVYQDQDWVRAIRHGIGLDGKSLLVMPAQEFNGINDADLGMLIAYVKSLTPVDNEVPDDRVGPLGRALLLAGQIPLLPAEMIDHDAPQPVAVAVGPTVEYGAYLAQTCKGCHGTGLSGGPIPGVPDEGPYPANLTGDPETGLGTWHEADFIQALRKGQRPDGSTIDSNVMPWPIFSQMTDTELSAIWLYLQSVPVQTYGNR